MFEDPKPNDPVDVTVEQLNHWLKCEKTLQRLVPHLKAAVWYWGVNMPKDAGATELEEYHAAKDALGNF